jgi:hypothetical protein
MRRLPALLSVVGIASALLLVPVPAFAGTVAPPPPVAEYPYKPSELTARTTTPGSTPWNPGTPLTPEQIADRNARYGVVEHARTTQATPRTAPQPLSPPKSPARVAGPLGYLLMVPVVVQGGLQILGVANELDELVGDNVVCEGVGPTTGNVFLSWLYGEQDCGMVITNPNGDVVGIDSLTRNGFTYSLTSFSQFLDTSTWAAYVAGPSLAAGEYMFVKVQSVPGQGFPSGSGWFRLSYSGSPTVISGDTLCAGAGFCDYNSWMGNTATGELRIANITNTTTYQNSTEIAGDPLRTPKCEVEALDGTIFTGLGTPYTETQGLPLGSAALGCEQAYEDFVSTPGRGPELPSRIGIESEQDGGSITEIAEFPVEQPEAQPTRGLRLEKIVGTTWKSCMTWEADCADWWTDTSQGTLTDVYRCYWGEEVISLAECGVYRNTFRNPSTPVVSDPVTGENQDWGSGPSPYTPPGANGLPVPTGGGACQPSWTWNPVDWVLNPLKCAFIPSSASISAAQSSITGAVDGTIVGSLQTGLTTIAGYFDGGAGCGGIPLHLEAFGHVIVHTQLLAACEEPYAGTAAAVNGFLSVATVVTAILAFTRYLGSVFAFASFGSSKGDDSGVRFK